MVTYYKLTDKNGMTQNQTQWGEGITHKATGSGKELCSDGYIHFYEDPLLAVLFNHLHANFRNPKLWECSISGDIKSDMLKCGAKEVTTIRELPLPQITTTQKIAFGILCALEVYTEESFVFWATNWLNGSNRKHDARAAVDAAAYAARAAADTYAYAAYAAYAADAAAYAAYAADAAAYAAYAADAAAYAAYAAHHINLDFVHLAQKAMEIE